MAYAVGIDIGGTSCKLGLFTKDGSLIEKWEIPTRIEEDGKFILDDLKESLFSKLEEKKILHADILGIGMGIPGPVLEDGTVNKCINLGWGVFNIEEKMSKKTGFPVKAGNDANVAALGESWQGTAKAYTSSIMVTIGTGVGAGIILDNKIVTGAFGAAGEIGHIKVRDKDEEKCGCGNEGCLEQYASATGLVRLVKELIEKSNGESSLKTYKKISAKAVFDQAKEGDEISRKAIKEMTFILGTVLANLASTVNPEIIVIGGGVSKAGDDLIKPLKEVFLKRCFHACKATKIEKASLGNDAGIYGGAKLIIG